jgi:hypothetical protein
MQTDATQFIWIFNGSKGKFPGGVFTTLDQAEQWIHANALTGVLTQFPVNEGGYDWALKTGLIKPSATHDADFIASFSSASYEHYHYENGRKE